MTDIAITLCCDESLQYNSTFSNEISLELIKKAGFKKVFLSWVNNGWGETHEKIFDLCKKHDIEIAFAHIGYRGTHAVTNLWKDGKLGDEVAEAICQDLEKVKEHGISIAVMHVSKSNENPVLSQLGIRRFEKIVAKAEELGIELALENTAWKGVLEYIFDNIKSDKLKVCYDSGHDHAHFKDTFDFKKFKGLIVATHMHDNHANGDEHLLPFDGTVDWTHYVVENLKNAEYEGTLSCEACYRNEYEKIEPQKFFEMAYERMLELNKRLKGREK